VYDRYDITDESDLVDAAMMMEKLATRSEISTARTGMKRA